MKLQRSRIYQIEKIRDSFSAIPVGYQNNTSKSVTTAARACRSSADHVHQLPDPADPAPDDISLFQELRRIHAHRRNFGGSMPIATPPGVPVAMIVPAFSVIPCDSSAIASSTVVIM